MAKLGSVTFYERNTFDEIPKRKGIYAFFLNFEYMLRAYNNSPNHAVDVGAMLDKTRRAHRLSRPKQLRLNMYGKSKSFSSGLDLSGLHDITYDVDKQPAPVDFFAVASALSKCTLLTPPLYIGITLKQTFRKRFKQHRSHYNQYRADVNQGTVPAVDPVSPQGEFYEKLVRRGVEFRDLAYVCVPLVTSELKRVKYVERLLQAMCNPALSTSH